MHIVPEMVPLLYERFWPICAMEKWSTHADQGLSTAKHNSDHVQTLCLHLLTSPCPTELTSKAHYTIKLKSADFLAVKVLRTLLSQDISIRI